MTVVGRLRARLARFERNVAIIAGERRLTYGDLFERVDRLSAGLAQLGVGRGDIVLAYLPNTPEAIECELSVLESGFVWVTLTARLTWAEVRGVAVTCRPKVIVTDARGRDVIRTGNAELPLETLPPIVVTGDGEAQSGDIAYESLLARSPASAARPSIRDEAPARLRYTSGTTGTAKAAVLPHRVYHASLDNLLAELPPLSEADRTLHVAPLTHGSGALVYPTLYAGGANVLLEQFDVDQVLESIARDRISTMFTVPTILSRLVTAPGFLEADLSSLRSLIYGGAPMPEAQLRFAVERIGHALMHIYGMTEAPWPIATLHQSEHRLDNPRLRSVGKPTSVCEVRIVDGQGEGTPLPRGSVGEIQIRGRNVMSGYFEDEESTRAVLSDGWLSSGDLGYLDGDGYLFIVDRMKDVIISGGFNVYAAEVETALSEHAGVLEAAVVGIPHPDWGETVAAFVVPAPGATLHESDLARFAEKRLSGYKRPRRIEIVAALPKNATGKIQKAELVARRG